MQSAGSEALEADPPTIIYDPYAGVMDEFKFRIMHPIGTYSGGRLPVYKAAVFHRTGPLYLGLSIEDIYVAVKCVRTKQNQDCARELKRQADINRAVIGNGNVIAIEKPFFYGGRYCVIFPYMSMGSMRYILKTKFPNGMPENCILVILKEALTGLSSIHNEAFAHNRFNSSCIFLNQKPEIKIAFSASVYTPMEEQEIQSSSSTPVSEICTWAAAPEQYHNHLSQNGPQADIWMVGMTALELACGGLPVTERRDLDLMTKKIIKERRLPRPDDEINHKKKYSCFGDSGSHRVSFAVRGSVSTGFEEMVARCLEWSAEERPTADQLLEMDIFRELGMTVLDFYKLMRDLPVVQD